MAKNKEKGKNKDKKNKKAEKKAQAAIEQENEGISDPEINEKVELEEDPIKSNEKIIESMKEAGSDDMESDEENSENEQVSKQKPDDKEESKKNVYDKEDEKKTVFCGNIPNSELTRGKIKALFTKFGPLKSLRFRTATGGVIFSKKLKKSIPSFNAYIVFQNEEDAKKSLELNGHKLGDNHLRVNMANNKESFTNKGTLFVGNLPFESTEAEVHEFFSQAGDIEYVRKLPKKGVAFICFKKGVSLANALKLNDTEFKGRKLRVARSESKQKQERKKLFKKDPKTGRMVKQKVKKSNKLSDKLMKGKPNINNPIVKKIKDTQKAKYMNKSNESSDVSKKELFRRGGKMDKDNREVNREKLNKKQKFFGSKVDEPKDKKKIKKGKVTKTAKEQKVIAKKLKSAALRTKAQ